jgi:hypothetical protein
MFVRNCIKMLGLICIVLPFAGCVNTEVSSIQITPATQSLAVGQTVQFSALGTVAHGSHPSSTLNVTNQVTWSSSTPAVATIGATTGLATALTAGTTTITASMPGTEGATATVTVTGAGGGAVGGTVVSISIVPGGITVSNKGMTGQFLAFGTFATAPLTRDITNSVYWISTSPEVATISNGGVTGEIGGLATAMGYTGDSVLYAEATNPDGTVILSNSQTFTCKDPQANTCIQSVAVPETFATITVFNAGENSTTWLVTAPSDTGTPNLISCGPGSTTGSVCTGTYENNSVVTLTESPTGSGFGGWSAGSGCVVKSGNNPSTGKPYTLLDSPTCTVTLTGDTSVGAIFY